VALELVVVMFKHGVLEVNADRPRHSQQRRPKESIGPVKECCRDIEVYDVDGPEGE